MFDEGFVDETDYSTLRKDIDLALVNVQTFDFELTEVRVNEVLT